MSDSTPEMIQRVALDNEPISGKTEAEIVEDAEMHAEVWGGNPRAEAIFADLGWKTFPVTYHRMWLNNEATPEQGEGGIAHKSMFAIFDAAIG